MQGCEAMMRHVFEAQGLAKEQRIPCQRTDTFILPGCAPFHVLSFQFRCPLPKLHMEQRLASQFMSLCKKSRSSVEWMERFFLQRVVHNPYRVLNLGWHESWRHSKAHKKAKTACFTLISVNGRLASLHKELLKSIQSGESAA